MKPRAITELKEGDIVEGPKGERFLLATGVDPQTGKAEWVSWAARQVLHPKNLARTRGNIAKLIGEEAAQRGTVYVLEDFDLGLA